MTDVSMANSRTSHVDTVVGKRGQAFTVECVRVTEQLANMRSQPTSMAA